jgi:hypothetical protein
MPTGGQATRSPRFRRRSHGGGRAHARTGRADRGPGRPRGGTGGRTGVRGPALHRHLGGLQQPDVSPGEAWPGRARLGASHQPRPEKRRSHRDPARRPELAGRRSGLGKENDRRRTGSRFWQVALARVAASAVGIPWPGNRARRRGGRARVRALPPRLGAPRGDQGTAGLRRRFLDAGGQRRGRAHQVWTFAGDRANPMLASSLRVGGMSVAPQTVSPW